MKPGHIAPEAPVHSASRLIRVLVIDDSMDICDMVCTMARGSPDLEASSLTTTTSLLSILKLWTPDVIVMDLTIPGESPLDVLRWLYDTYPDIRTIAFTGRDDNTTLDHVFDAGGWGLVSKNDDLRTLFETVRRVASSRGGA